MEENESYVNESPEQGEGTMEENPQSETTACKKRSASNVGDNAAEAVLSFIAYTILVLGIAFSVLIGWLLMMDRNSWDNKIGTVLFIGGPIVSIITWASCMILVNISNNVRQIKHELRDMN